MADLALLDAASATAQVQLLDRFDLAADADRPASTYSGGMHRELDVRAAGEPSDPAVLFLDQPTTGLDPRSRRAVLRDIVRDLS